MPDNKIDYNSAKDAHWRIDELEKDFNIMNECLQKISDNQEKTAKRALVTNGMIAGGLSLYVIDSIGLLKFIQSVL